MHNDNAPDQLSRLRKLLQGGVRGVGIGAGVGAIGMLILGCSGGFLSVGFGLLGILFLPLGGAIIGALIGGLVGIIIVPLD